MDENTFETLFWNLPSSEQYRLVSSLVSSSDDYFKWRLKNLVASIETPDILTLLPPELQLHILSYVNGCTLLTACQVSKKWNKIIKSFDSLWKAKAMQIGVCIEDKPADCSWVKAFSKSMRQLHYLKAGEAFCGKFINLQNKNDLVKAIDYNDGYLCTVSGDDLISIWVLDLNVPVLTFSVYYTVSCVKFKPCSTLVCGHFSGMLSSWDLSEMNDVCYRVQDGSFVMPSNYHQADMFLKNKFKMHTGPVFSCDFSENIELLVSGGGDNTIKFWNLRNGQLLHSINNESQWILKVVLLVSNTKSHKVIAMRREAVDKYQWPTNPAHLTYDSEPEEYFKNLNFIQLTNSVPLNECDDVFTIPGFQISLHNIGLIIQDLQEKYATLNLLDLDTFKIQARLPLHFKVRKFLAMGKRFATFLTVGKALYTSSLVVVDITTGKIVGTQPIPHSKMTTPDGSQLVIGDTRWLDGLRGWEFYDDRDTFSDECCCELENCLPGDLDERSARKCTKCLKGMNNLGSELATSGGACSIGRKLPPLNSERKFLILAAGIKSENGKFFSLWWKRRCDEKTKTD